jgi:hypothetical protein
MTKKATKKKDKVVDLAKKRKAKKDAPYKVRDGFKIKEAIRMNSQLTMALGSLVGRPHHWCGFTLGKLKPIIRQYDADLETHADYKAYNEAFEKLKDAKGRLSNAAAQQLAKDFPDYLEYVEDLNEGQCELTVRCFRAEWVLKVQGHPALTSLLTDLDLWDDPDKAEDLIFQDEEKEE